MFSKIKIQLFSIIHSDAHEAKKRHKHCHAYQFEMGMNLHEEKMVPQVNHKHFNETQRIAKQRHLVCFERAFYIEREESNQFQNGFIYGFIQCSVPVLE